MSDQLLFVLTSTINFIGLATTFWLGLYIITRGPHGKFSWVASATLWSLSGSFLNTLIYIHAPPASGMLPWWWGWSVAISAPFMFHLSVSLLPSARRKKQTWMVILMYFLTLNFIAMETYTSLIFTDTAVGIPLSNAVFNPGPLYPVLGIFLIIIPGISLYNLRLGWHLTKAPDLRKQFTILILGMGFAMVGAIYGSLSIWYGLPTPKWLGDLFLGISGLAFGYALIRMNAILEGQFHTRDFFYTSVATFLVVGAYLLAALFSNLTFDVPFIAFIFIIILAILSHSLVDWGRGRLDRIFYRSFSELRSELRDFSRTTITDQALQDRLRALLNTLCQAVEAKEGWIAIRDGDEFKLVVDKGDEPLDRVLDSDLLFADEIKTFTSTDKQIGMEEARWLVPLVAGEEQIGVILLGQVPRSTRYAEEDILLLEDFADIVASVIHGVHVQEGNLEQITELITSVRQSEREVGSRMLEAVTTEALHPFLKLKDEQEAISLVEDALRNLHDFSFLGDHPLATLKIVRQSLLIGSKDSVTHIDRGKALQQVLFNGIEKLKPLTPKPRPPSKEWHQFVILHDCYLEGKLNRVVMGELYIGEGTFNRARRRAVRAVTRVIAELEGNLQEF